MNINATLLVQALVFITFVLLTMKYIWPLLSDVLEKRRQEIADGLAAAEQGKQSLALAASQAEEIITEAKQKAASILDQSNAQAQQIVENAKQQAREEGQRLLALAQDDIQRQYDMAKNELMQQVSQMVVLGAEKVLQKEIDKASNDHLISQFIKEEIN